MHLKRKKERKKGKNTADKSIYLLGFFRYRSSHRRCSVKKLFLEISQNSQEKICARESFLIKFQG